MTHSKKMIFTILGMAAIAVSAFGNGARSAEIKPSDNVILISWDGVQRNHLKDMLKEGRLPNLDAMIKAGKFVELEVTNHKTDTKAGHTQMLTGYAPEITGVYNNAKYGPIPKGYSIFERLESSFGADSIRTVMLTGKNHHIGSMPAGDCPKMGGKLKKKKAKKTCPAEPWNIVKDGMDVWNGDLQRDASAVGPLALKHLDDNASGKFFMFFHFSDPDHAGHRFGENSEQYSQGIVDCDTWLGTIRNELKKLGIDGKTTVYVTTDHGFDEGMRAHKDAPHIWIASSDTNVSASSGDQMDIVPTIFKRMGLSQTGFTPLLPGKPLF